ncbi:MAG: hypothetical protein KAV87_13680 [Desulfobacteraceae bacterium]|nr:hypothetical protein [Desulfobacteraceae bacterium]
MVGFLAILSVCGSLACILLLVFQVVSQNRQNRILDAELKRLKISNTATIEVCQNCGKSLTIAELGCYFQDGMSMEAEKLGTDRVHICRDCGQPLTMLVQLDPGKGKLNVEQL